MNTVLMQIVEIPIPKISSMDLVLVDELSLIHKV